MTEVLLSNQLFTSNQLELECSIVPEELYGYNNLLFANRPYMISQEPSFQDKAIFKTLDSAPENSLQNLTEMALSFGPEKLNAIAEMMVNLKEYEIALTGAGASVYSSRIGEFGVAVQRYQEAILDYREVAWPNASNSIKSPEAQRIRNAFQRMQQRFSHELATVSEKIPYKKHKGTPLTHPERAINIARSSRKATKLNVVSQAQAHNLVKFSKYGRYLGSGLVVVDFASRAGNIHNSYQGGGNWERDLFIESSSFTLSSIAGILSVKAGLSFLMVATPAGWVGLIIGGAIVAGAAAASISMDQYSKKNSALWYDAIMETLDRL